MDLTRVRNIAFAFSVALAIWVIYPAICWALARIYRDRVIKDAEDITKGVA